MKIDQIYSFKCLQTIHKAKLELVPPSIGSLFQSPHHNINTRFSINNFRTPLIRNNSGLQAPSYVCITLWSVLPDEIKSQNPNLFKISCIDLFMSD